MVNSFPTFDVSARTGDPIGIGDANSGSARGLSVLASAADAFSQRMQGMANAAAGREGAAQADADLKAGGPITPKNDATAFGLGYNNAARLAKSADYKAALQTGLQKAQLDNPDDVAGYTQAAQAVRAGLGKTGFADTDRELDAFTTLQVASGQAQVLQGQNRRRMEQVHQAFLSTLNTEELAIGHVATTASFDQAGSDLVAAQLGHSFDALATYGPRAAFDAGGKHYDADPNRGGVLGADDLEKAWQDMSASARSDWATGAAMGLPDAAAKRKFAADALERYGQNDPLFAGMDRDQFDRLHMQLDSIANRAETQEDAVRRQAAQDAGNMLEAMRWGGDVDTDQLKARARASGDVGLMQQAEVYASIGPQVPDVLRQVAARYAGGDDPDAAWATPVPSGPVFDQVRLQALSQGVDVAGQDALIRIANIESRGDPNARAPGGSASGVFQFVQGKGSRWEALGGGDPFDAKLNISRGVKSIVSDRTALSNKIGREATWGEAYLAHQQGVGGALAFLQHPGATAINALIKAGVPADTARASILGNGGNEGTKASDFARMWIDRVDTGGANDPASLAWANAKEGFRSDPLTFAMGGKKRAALASVSPLVPDGFADPAQQGAWLQALRNNYAVGQSLAQKYAVPQRILTDGQKTYYAGKLQADPAYGVYLAEAAMQAIGPQGAQALMTEIGGGGNAPVAVHLADLHTRGSSRIVDAALDGMKLRAAGAKPPEVKIKDSRGRMVDPLDGLQTAWSEAFQYAPQALIAARQVADDARLSERSRGIAHPDIYYLNGALGGQSKNGKVYGGVTSVNGRMTVIPSWLSTDQAGAALGALGQRWQSGGGPAWSDGSPMPAKDISRMQMVMLPDGRYGLVNPKTNGTVRDRNGGVFAFDLDAARGLMGAR